MSMFSDRYRQMFPPLISSWSELKPSNLRCVSFVPACSNPAKYFILHLSHRRPRKQSVHPATFLLTLSAECKSSQNLCKEEAQTRTMQLEISAHKGHSRTSKKIPLETQPYKKRNESISFAQAPTVTNNLRFCLYFVNFTLPILGEPSPHASKGVRPVQLRVYNCCHILYIHPVEQDDRKESYNRRRKTGHPQDARRLSRSLACNRLHRPQ